MDSNDDCQSKGLVRRQIIRPFPPGTAMFVDGKCLCGGENEILYEYVPGVRPADEATADNSDLKTMEPQSNNRVIGNYGSLVFTSDVQMLNLFNMKFKSVCCNCVHSSPLSNKLLNNDTKNKLSNKVSKFDTNEQSYNTTICINDERDTVYPNIENTSDKFPGNKTSQMELNGLVHIENSKIESDSSNNISSITETPKLSLMETSTTDAQNNYFSTVVEVKMPLDSREENVNNMKHIGKPKDEKPDKQLLSTTKNDTNRINNYVFVQTTKQHRYFKPKHITSFKNHNVLSYNNNKHLLLIIN